MRLMASYGASSVPGERPSFGAYTATAAGQGQLQAFLKIASTRVCSRELPTQGERSDLAEIVCSFSSSLPVMVTYRCFENQKAYSTRPGSCTRTVTAATRSVGAPCMLVIDICVHTRKLARMRSEIALSRA